MIQEKNFGIFAFVCAAAVLATVAAFPGSQPNSVNIYQYTLLNESREIEMEPQSNPVIHKNHRRFIPFAKPLKDQKPDVDNCSSSEDDFPTFILTDEQVRNGGVVLCILIGIYSFTLLACVCDGYFIPCVETICEMLNLTPDVAAATFMSVATSTPELFTNLIGTFITQSDIGIGTIVGSSLFNGLGVAAIGGLCAPYALQLDWWPLTRDCSIYICAVGVLVSITWDGIIFWYEALILVIIYFLYFTVMFQNDRISRWVKGKLSKNNKNLQNVVLEPPSEKEEVPRISIISAYGTYVAADNVTEESRRKTIEKLHEQEKIDARRPLFRKPEGTMFEKFIFYYVWPLQFLLKITIPNSVLYPRIFPLTFLMCIIWIGVNSYVVSWMITIIGNLVNVSDSVMGMTLLAAGGCLPESISMTIIARRGEGAFGVSNSLGANTMNILFSLGMPWFFKNMADGATTSRPVIIQSGSIEYTIMALIFVSICLYCTLAINKFRLSKLTGVILICVYLTMAALAILMETTFFDNGPC